MGALKRYFTDKLSERPDVSSVLYYMRSAETGTLTDTFDVLLLVVTRTEDKQHAVYHYSQDGLCIQERWVDRGELLRMLSERNYRSLLYGLLQGEILLDREAFLEELRLSWSEFPDDRRQKRLFAEFASFLRTYLLSKQYMMDGDLLDAYNHILEALHHWAHIVLIEEGMYPEITVWKQIRKVNPGVYKLYEELASSHETLEQRVQLVLLACEFSIMSKMKRCCAVLLAVLESREEPWSIEELNAHPELRELADDVTLVVRKLVKRSFIRELAYVVKGVDMLELRYTV